MKIIAPDTPPTPPDAPWWVGKTVHCDQCNGDILLEEGDAVNAAPGPGDLRTVVLNCPRCNAIASYSESAAPAKAAKTTAPAAPPAPDAAPADAPPAASESAPA